MTGSRKKRVGRSRVPHRPPPKAGNAWLDALDAVDERCDRIETVAGLLNACADPEAMDAKLAARAGYLIEEEMRRVKKLLTELGKGTP